MWGILILKPNIELIEKMEMNVDLAKKICPLPIDHTLQNFLTISLLFLSLAFKDSTFEFELMKKQNLP
jgi:hypothetical protein